MYDAVESIELDGEGDEMKGKALVEKKSGLDYCMLLVCVQVTC